MTYLVGEYSTVVKVNPYKTREVPRYFDVVREFDNKEEAEQWLAYALNTEYYGGRTHLEVISVSDEDYINGNF